MGTRAILNVFSDDWRCKIIGQSGYGIMKNVYKDLEDELLLHGAAATSLSTALAALPRDKPATGRTPGGWAVGGSPDWRTRRVVVAGWYNAARQWSLSLKGNRR